MKQDERKALIGKYILLILGSVLILVPLLATLFSSFKPTKDIVDNFFGFPTNFTWDNFSRLLSDGIGGYYWNSVVITVLSLLAVMIFIPMAAYSIARNMSKRKAFTIMYTLLILGIFVPFQVIMIPITVMMSKLQYNYAGQYFNDYGPSFASYVVGIISITIVYLFFQRHIIAGMSNGAVK